MNLFFVVPCRAVLGNSCNWRKKMYSIRENDAAQVAGGIIGGGYGPGGIPLLEVGQTGLGDNYSYTGECYTTSVFESGGKFYS
jgi:hypothetical protein